MMHNYNFISDPDDYMKRQQDAVEKMEVIRNCLQYLLEEANGAGFDSLSKVLTVADYAVSEDFKRITEKEH